MNEDSLVRGTELFEQINKAKTHIEAIEKRVINSLYIENYGHIKIDGDFQVLIERITTAHLKSTLFKLEKEFNSL